MRKYKKKRAAALMLASVLTCSNIFSSVSYAQDGWTESQFLDNPVYAVLRDFTFSNTANGMAETAGVVPTGLGLELTFTHRKTLAEPFGYGKWWLSNERGQAATNALVPLASDMSKKVAIDFSKIANHYTSCIEEHNGNNPGTGITGNDTLPYVNVYSGQFFAHEAYIPTDNPADYPAYIKNTSSDIQTKKFYLLLMSILHSYDEASAGDLKDDFNLTEYSAVCFSFTRALENGRFTSVPSSYDSDWSIVAAEERGIFSTEYNPNANNDNLYEKAFGSGSGAVQAWFKRCWEDPLFMSQFTYTIADGASANGSSIDVIIPLTQATEPGEDGRYHRVWDYSQQTNTTVLGKNQSMKLKTSGPSGIKVENQNGKLDLSAATAEELSDENLAQMIFVLDSGNGKEQNIQPAGLVAGRNAVVNTNGTALKSTGQLRFASFSMPVSLRPGTGVVQPPSGGGGGGSTPSAGAEVIRYKHTEQFTADYTVNLRKFDSETGQPLEGSHWDILEAFPDYQSQLDATMLEGAENWANDSGTQFIKWDGWDQGNGNPDGGTPDPCALDDDVTNSEGILTYGGSGDVAHTDTKNYTYIKGFCGGHPEKPEPEEDEETGEILNQDEIDAWEEEVETCTELVAEGGFFCATAENGYENGEDSSGEESKKEMEDDRDLYYEQFISLVYKYSAVETQARPGYIIHDVHTDDIPIEEKTVTSSQLKDYNSSCGGSVTSLPHQASQGGSSSGSIGDAGEVDTFSLRRLSSAEMDADDNGGLDRLTLAQAAEGLTANDTATPSDAETESEQSVDAAVLAVPGENRGINTATPSEISYSLSEGNEEEGEENRYLAFLRDLKEQMGNDEYGEYGQQGQSDEEEEIPDLTLLDDTNTFGINARTKGVATIATSSAPEKVNTSTESDAQRDIMMEEKQGWLSNLYEEIKDLAIQFYDMLHGAVAYMARGARSMMSFFSVNDNSRASGNSHPVRDSVTWTMDGPGNYIQPLKNDIVDHTFTVFDHRTEGEIHINKRDLALQDKEGGSFDSYSIENADGTLEGAVYGLFAADDIIHPDGKTGTVYQADDLVAVASTDRNGDASFMVFTEAPGSTYDYETGKISKRTDSPFNGPENLHKPQDEGDAAAEDNESYIGHDSQNNEVQLIDSEAGNSMGYYKHSSNQDGIEGLEGGYETYPILNNEENNGNCWIGRPLIAADTGTQYYVKELTRSEGYELSVSGKTNYISNGKDSWQVNGSSMQVKIGTPTYSGSTQSIDTTIKGIDVDRDVILKIKTGEGASFASVYKTTEQYEATEVVVTPVEVPVIGTAGDDILLNSKKVEASIGMTVTVNGTDYRVTQVSEPDQPLMGAVPANKSIRGVVEKPTLGTSSYNEFMNAFNAELSSIGYKVPSSEAPWIRIELDGNNDTDWIGAVDSAMRDQGILFFNRARITDIITESGKTYAILRYDHATKDVVDTCIYNTERNSLFVKYDTGHGYFVYAEIPVFSDMVVSYAANDTGFVTSASLKKASVNCATSYPSALPANFSFIVEPAKTYWVYDGTMQRFNNDGTLMTTTEFQQTEQTLTKTREVEVLTAIPSVFEGGYYTVTIPRAMFDSGEPVSLRIYAKDGSGYLASVNISSTTVTWAPTDAGEDSYIQKFTLTYPGQNTIYDTDGTEAEPRTVNERSLRQKIKIEKDIQTLPETKDVWYCLNCGYENADGDGSCHFCGRDRSTEETKHIDYAHDTYAAVHADNISAERDGGFYETAKDWLAKLLGGTSENEEPESIGNFRFKAYLKSNLERLYRDENGNIVWMDRNGNTMTPQYMDTNGDGNYDTFTWKYDAAYGGKTVDFPEKDILAEDGSLASSNVQKIYTEVEHRAGSMTTSARANNVWDTYADPQTGARANAGEIEGYTTSEREVRAEGNAVKENAALYSYDGILVDRDRSDYLQDTPNSGYTRILETRRTGIEDGTGLINIESYNYDKFFDAIDTANTDLWDNDMHSTYTGDRMENYPGQHWFETFYEKYQKDDTDPDHTMADTDGADADGTAGGDKDTSFKPFRWIREHVFGYRDGYEKYPADNNGVNTENRINTSEFARANAQASDAVRQFAVKWYLEDEAAKLMVDNGLGENIAKQSGTIGYDEAVYDQALFEAIAKAYNYLRPFYYYDLDTIYSVEWDSAADGGADKDYTTLSTDLRTDERYYNVSSYLPYGVYVVVEQQPSRRDKDVNDWENRSFSIEKPKEVIIPSVYDAAQSNNTTDNYDTHYNFDADGLLTDQAKASNYLIRFGEENSANTTNQDNREFIIRAHGYYGDFEVYKYGLDIDSLQGTVSADNGTYSYGGWDVAQETYDPLKDYYETDHRGEKGVAQIGKENGGNDASQYHGSDPGIAQNPNGADTANTETYDSDTLRRRFFYASIAEDDGIADKVLFKDGAVDDNNASGMSWHDNVRSTTGELTAYDGKYSAALVPWTVTEPTDLHVYSSNDFTGYADVNERNTFFTTTLRINKVDSETGEYILHDDAIFGLYAASRYNSFDEIEQDAELIDDPDEKARFLMQFKPGDAKFYLQDTMITGSREFLEAMGATELQPYRRRTTLVESQTDPGHLYVGVVKKGTPVCLESERIDLSDSFGEKTGQMTVWSTKADIRMDDADTQTRLEYGDQNVGYFKTSQPIGAGVYVLAEIKAPDGYARSKPVAIEVYSDETSYYVDGDMYAKVAAVRYEANLLDEYPYK